MTQSQLYLGWQLDMKNVQDSVQSGLERYYKKFGMPPELILVSDQLDEQLDLSLVVHVQRVPRNILFIGRYLHEQMQENWQDKVQKRKTGRQSHDANLFT